MHDGMTEVTIDLLYSQVILNILLFFLSSVYTLRILCFIEED